MAAKIQDGRHILKFSEYLGISAVVIPRILKKSISSLYYRLIYIQVSDPGCANPKWPPKSKMAAIYFYFSKYSSFSALFFTVQYEIAPLYYTTH
jgi:hypothetical protein